MNSVSPSAAQYSDKGGVMQDELVESRRQQPMERQSSFGLRSPQTPDPREPDEVDKLKVKLMSVWNNVKYGLLIKSVLFHFSFIFILDSKLWLLLCKVSFSLPS